MPGAHAGESDKERGEADVTFPRMSSFGVSEIDDSNFLVGVISPIEKHEPA